MAPISNVDQAVQLLRLQLKQLREKRTAGRNSDASTNGVAFAGIRRLIATQGLPPRDLNRALIRALLSREFGSHHSSDSAFVALADEVTTLLESDEQASSLLAEAIGEIGQRRDGPSL